MTLDPSLAIIILIAGLATYGTRIGGYLVINRFKSIHPRVQAALDSVPAAVLTTLVAPAFFAGDWRVKLAMAIGLALGLRFSFIPMLLGGWAAAIFLRHML